MFKVDFNYVYIIHFTMEIWNAWRIYFFLGYLQKINHLFNTLPFCYRFVALKTSKFFVVSETHWNSLPCSRTIKSKCIKNGTSIINKLFRQNFIIINHCLRGPNIISSVSFVIVSKVLLHVLNTYL